MVGFASRAPAMRRRVEQVPKKLIREKRPRSENDLGRPECKCSGSACLLSLQRRDERLRPEVAREGFAHRVVERAHETVGVVWCQPGNPRQVLLKDGFGRPRVACRKQRPEHPARDHLVELTLWDTCLPTADVEGIRVHDRVLRSDERLADEPGMLHAKQVVAPRRGLHALLRRIIELAKAFRTCGDVRFARRRIDAAKRAVDRRHSRATKGNAADGPQKLLCIDSYDCSLGHCPRAGLNPVAQLAVIHRK